MNEESSLDTLYSVFVNECILYSLKFYEYWCPGSFSFVQSAEREHGLSLVNCIVFF